MSGNKLRKISASAFCFSLKYVPGHYVILQLFVSFIAVFTLPLSACYFAFNRSTESISPSLNFEPLLFLLQGFFFPAGQAVNQSFQIPSPEEIFYLLMPSSYIDFWDFTVAVNLMDSPNCLLTRTVHHTGFKCCYFRTPYVLHLVL